MPIEVRCDCGKRLKARDGSAGKRVKCPACGAAVRVPGAAPARPGCPTRNEGDIEIWSAPAVVIPSLVAVNAEVLCLVTTLTDGKAEAIRQKLEQGQAPKAVLGRLGSTIIPLGDVLGACLERQRGNIDLRHTEFSGAFRAEAQQPQRIQFADTEAGADFMEALHRRLGPGWVLRSEQHGRWQASWRPAVGGCVSLFFTLVILVAGPFHSWATGCMFFFVLLTFLACMVVLGVYLVDPPLMVYLVPREG